MKHRAPCCSFLCVLLAALLLPAGDASAHGIEFHTDTKAEAAQPGEAPAPKGEVTVDMAALEDMFAHVLDARLAPVEQALAQRAAGPDLRDIVGGIGWIIGLLGLAAYMKYRRQAQG